VLPCSGKLTNLKSNFKTDLSKEQRLTPLLDTYYQKHLKNYEFERVSNLKKQRQGIDLILKDNRSGNTYFVDEKAQLDYINESLPTFAFELFYTKNGVQKQGWLFDVSKKTHFYALVTSIYSDEADVFTSCNITFVNREKLILRLHELGLNQSFLEELALDQKEVHGKLVMERLDPKKEGYLYFSSTNKVEKPVNLILRLEFLNRLGVAKRLV
jgi:hypothetical protein